MLCISCISCGVGVSLITGIFTRRVIGVRRQFHYDA
jgi:hypothetical protein